MIYDPAKHHRRSIRLHGYDYTRSGAYFVTIRAHERTEIFGHVTRGRARLSPFGGIVFACWFAIPDHFPFVTLDAFVVMPDHIHGIIVIGADHGGVARRDDDHRTDCNAGIAINAGIDGDAVGAQHAAPLQSPPATQSPPPAVQPGSLGAIVRSFKSAATREVNELRGMRGAPLWQRNYYEHIIRDNVDLDRIRCYIVANPARYKNHH